MPGMDELLRLEDAAKEPLVRIYPKYARLRQGSEIRYRLKLTRSPSKGKAVTIHVVVILNRIGISASPTQLVVTSKDWRQTREVTVSSSEESDLRTFQIHHKIHESYDEVYNANTILPSLFVSVLQKEATFLFGFGCGIDGRLGTDGDTNTSAPAPFPCGWLHPLHLACGKAHSAVVDVYSNLYCFGLGANGQLGQGDDNLESSQEPLRVHQLASTSVQYVACGSNHTLCVSADGRVFAWGDNSFGQLGMGCRGQAVGTPYRVEKTHSVRAIACGGGQSFILTRTSVLACGSNVAGQLGLGDRIDRATFEAMPFFRKVCTSSDPFAEEHDILDSVATEDRASPEEVKIACGTYHTMALAKGRVYTWGNGDDGRLGHGDHESRLFPTLLNSLKDMVVTAIACGGSHSGCVVAADGDVYTWGSGSLGQLGLGTTRSRCTPTRVRLLQDKGVTQLAFGEWHSTALCQNGTLFAWGFGEEGQLGLPNEDLEPTRRVAVLPVAVHALHGTGATLVACGGSHTFVVTAQENRRQHLAQMHRQPSHQNVRQEEATISTIDRRQPKRMSESQHPSNKAIPTVRESGNSQVPRHGSPTLTKRRTSASATRRCNSARRAQEPAPQSVCASIAETFSWRARPLTSRLSVRNALHQQTRNLEAWHESIMLPDVLPPRKVGVSPRLLRLSKQAARQSSVENPLTTQTVADAVNAATEDLRIGSMGFRLESCGPKSKSLRQIPARPGLTYNVVDLIELTRSLDTVSTSTFDVSDSLSGDSGEDDEEITVFGGSNTLGGCQALEADIRQRSLDNSDRKTSTTLNESGS